MAYWNYAGYLLPFGFIAAFGQEGDGRTRRVTLLTFLLSFVYAINLWPLSYLFNALPVLKYESPDMRFRIIYPGLLLILLAAGESWDRLLRGEKLKHPWALIIFTLVFIAVQTIWLAMDYRARHHLGAIAISRAVLVMALVILGIRLRAALRKQGRPVLTPASFILLLALDMITLSWLGIPRNDPSIFEPQLQLPVPGRGFLPERAHFLSFFGGDAPEPWRQVRLDQGRGWICGYIRNGLMRQDQVLTALEKMGFSNFGYQAIRSETQPLLNYLSIKYVATHKAPVMLAQRLPLFLPVLKSAYRSSGIYQGRLPGLGDHGFTLEADSEWSVTMDLIPGDALVMGIMPESGAARVEVRVGSGADAAARSWTSAEPLIGRPSGGKLLLPIVRRGEQVVSILVSGAGGSGVEVIKPEIWNEQRPYEEVSGGEFPIFRNRQALDWYGLYSAVETEDDDKALEDLFNPERFSPSSKLMLAPSDLDPRIPVQEPRPRQPEDVKVLEYTNSRVVLEAAPASPSYLSIAESYYPGWQAEADGKPERIARANYAYQSVPLASPGLHRIILRFLPAEFRIGLWVSLGSAASALLLAFGTTLFRIRKPGAAQ